MRGSMCVLIALFAGCTPATDDGATDGTTDDGNNNDTTFAEYDAMDGVECSNDEFCTLSGDITEDLHLIADIPWVLSGGVFIGTDDTSATLTIDPGATVYGESATDGMLVITRGSKIMAEGTADMPIVFTSSKAAGDRARGDWGGIIINGYASINSCGDAIDDCEALGEGGVGWYGGDDDADDSGVLRYLRVEFAGTLISPDNELNGIAFQGVGSGTEVDYIQVHMNADDGVEFFGGTVDVKHVLVTGAADDSLDWTDGWRGRAQYVALQQFDDAGDNGIEADNNGEANDASPRSNPQLRNLTLVGSPDSAFSDTGILLREGTGADIADAVVTSFNDNCFDIDHAETFANAWDSGDLSGGLVLENSILDCATNWADDDDDGTEFTIGEFVETLNTGNTLVDPMLADATNLTTPDFLPEAGSPALGNGLDMADAFFDAVDYIGAFGSDDWTAGWSSHELN